MKTMTEKQAARFAEASAKLPDGFAYEPCYKNDNRETVPLWGVILLFNGKEVGYVGKHKRGQPAGFQDAHTLCAEAERPLVRRLLNRASAALWHTQPAWQI